MQVQINSQCEKQVFMKNIKEKLHVIYLDLR